MVIKKIAQPINKAKNQFVKWLKDHKSSVDTFTSDDPEWDYYVNVYGFINGYMIDVYFQIYHGEVNISYRDEENRYNNMSIQEFLTLIN